MNASTRLSGLIALAAALLQGCGGSGSSDSVLGPDPALITPQATLDAALNCTPFAHPDKPPVLMVHGLGASGAEEYTLFYTPQLVAMGFDVCILTYPDRGFIDLQISAEYVVNALRSMNARSGRKVAMIGHSQGALMPRWALRFWPSAREATAEFVLIAGPNHGTDIARLSDVAASLFRLLGLGSFPIGLVPESIYQFSPISRFVAAVNSVDETPGDIDYTTIYTRNDELVVPTVPVPTAALEFGGNNPRVTNILLQDICPLNLSEHFSIGTTDPTAFALAIDAISNPGPASVTRAGGPSEICALLPVDLTALLQQPLVSNLLSVVSDSVTRGLPTLHLAPGEPPLMPYAASAIAP